MIRKISALLLTVFTTLMIQATSFAAPITFDLAWSGASFGNSASATGSITFDDALLFNPGLNSSENNPGYVIDFSITVVDAAFGNGTWGLADYDQIYWVTDLALDLGQELIGQPTSQNPWGTSVPSNTGGDFNVFSVTPGAPTGVAYFVLSTNDGLGDGLLLTSFAPAPVPVPAAFWLLLSAVGALTVKARK